MYTRLLKNPQQSAFVFGPRAVGKSTWARSRFPDAIYYDLLDTSLYLDLSRDPNRLYREVSARPRHSWIVIDEIQRAPALLNEIHRLIENRQANVIMMGSSARKLRRGGVNLLGGRALTRTMFPLTSRELEFLFELDRALQYGTLPEALNQSNPQEYLRSYVETYLTQEVIAEALVRDVGRFARFLEVAAGQNGQPTNITSIARDTGTNRKTVNTHFEILSDTLVGSWLTPWKLKSSNRQLHQSKFYFCDTGIVRGLSNRLPYPPTPEERGFLLETFLFHELRAYLSYSNLHYPLHYWRSYDGAEVDFVLESSDRYIGIEVKAAGRWSNKFNRGFNRLAALLPPQSAFDRIGVYTGSREERWDTVRLFPLVKFLKSLWGNELIQ